MRITGFTMTDGVISSQLDQVGQSTYVYAMKKGRVNIYQAKTHFSGLVKRVKEKGETYVVFRGNEPVADIVPHVGLDKLPAPLKVCEGKAMFKGDPIQSSEDLWPGEFR